MAAVVRTEALRRFGAAAGAVVAVAAAYFLAGKLGLREEVVVGGVRVTPLWPPTGIAVAALLLAGLWIWPGIAIGAFLVVSSLGPPNWSTLGIVAGQTAAPVCALLLLRRVGFRVQLDRLRDGLALVFLGALIAMLVSSGIDTAVLLADGSLPSGQYWPIWSAWWTGDAMGVLVVAPVLLALRSARVPRGVPVRRWAEAAALLMSTAGAMVAATRSSLDLLFLVFPLVMWGALRFQQAGSAPCVLLVSLIAVPAAVDGTGPFAGHSLLSVMVSLQALNGAAALTGLLLAAVISERDNTRRQIERAVAELAEVVARLAPGEAAGPRPLPGEGE